MEVFYANNFDGCVQISDLFSDPVDDISCGSSFR